MKGLLKTVFSTTTLSRSLEKLAIIGRNTSPQAKNLRPQSNLAPDSSREKISLRDRANSHSSQVGQIRSSAYKFTNIVFILSFKRDIVFSYLMNTGYIGTYEPGYKLLFNKTQGYINYKIDYIG